MTTLRIGDSVGRVLGGRYRLIRPIGAGASAYVYVAEDVRLRRRVAIKVLHPSLAGDEGFLRRFRLEAQVVAGLQHPNILRVYDWGEDEGDPYLVSELLEGGSLRGLLDRGPRLTISQATEVGYDAASALDYAHKRGLVHRDIKPANLLFDGEGRLSVADFGLARALADASRTEPVGAVLGTARYAAPEQARGEVLTPKADLYALTLVLIEAVTGAVPFARDTTSATLMARQQPLEVPEELRALVPLLRVAGALNPDNRPDAGALMDLFGDVARSLPAPAPLPLAGAGAAGALRRDADPTSLGRSGRRQPARADEERWAPPAPGEQPVPFETTGPQRVGWDDDGDATAAYGLPTAMLAAAGAGAVAPPGQVGGDQDDWYEHTGGWSVRSWEGEPPAEADDADGAPPPLFLPGWERRRRWPWVVGAVTVAVCLAAGAGGWVLAHRPPPLVAVPGLRGETLAQARARLAADHLQLTVAGRAYNPTLPAGTVLSQTPSAGKLHEKDDVAVTVSLGPQPVKVPTHLAGLSKTEAERLIQAIGLAVGKIVSEHSLTMPKGDVIGSAPGKGTLLPGQRIDLAVSTGKPSVKVPKLTGAQVVSYANAAAALKAAHLAPSEQLSYSETVPAGEVISTQPAAGASVIYGSPVAVDVSRGPEYVAVPSVAGDTVAQADQILANYGFSVSGVTGNPGATVTGTSPPAGTELIIGSSVQIITSSGPGKGGGGGGGGKGHGKSGH